MDISTIINKYHGGGTSSYYPGMLLKVLLYGFASRSIQARLLKALREDVNFMWLAAYNHRNNRITTCINTPKRTIRLLFLLCSVYYDNFMKTRTYNILF